MNALEVDYDAVASGAIREVLRAKQKHGQKNFNSIHEGFAVLLKEVDELWDAVKLNPYKIDVSNEPVPGFKLNLELAMRETQRTVHQRMLREEAIQVAAMAIRFAAELT